MSIRKVSKSKPKEKQTNIPPKIKAKLKNIGEKTQKISTLKNILFQNKLSYIFKIM